MDAKLREVMDRKCGEHGRQVLEDAESDLFEKALEVCPECSVKMVVRDTAYPEDGGPGEYWLRCYVCGWTKTEIIDD